MHATSTQPQSPSPLLTEQPLPAFAARHIGPRDTECAQMLAELGVASLDALLDECIPDSIRRREALALPDALSEAAALAHLRSLAERNRVLHALIGMGYHGTHTPAVIQRNVLENPAWYTAYTPYQPEISQGRLEALLNYQTLVSELTGLPVANASLLDEATAAAEAMALARRASRTSSQRLLVDERIHPQTLTVLRTRAEPLGWQVVPIATTHASAIEDCFGLLLQYPDTFGRIGDPQPLIERAHACGALAIMACDPLALTLLKPPGQLGADVAVGSMQRFGVPMGFGGPHAAYLALSSALQRQLPGRLVGISVDRHGTPAYRLALQTREQHIRREKATSNICTAQALLAIVASMYAVYHGPEGLVRIARQVHQRARRFAQALRDQGYRLLDGEFFDTVTVFAGERQRAILERARTAGIALRVIAPGGVLTESALGVAFDETVDEQVMGALVQCFDATLPEAPGAALPAALQRTDPFMAQPVFHRYRSETELMRYLRRLADRDLALDRTMIPLGSCTMKLNAAAEMQPISWPEFSALHPYAPQDSWRGYAQLFQLLEHALAEITGFDAVSLQPNAGAQGEYAGLLAIRRYHRARGQHGRHVCLIPASAHGTNPASAALAGMRVVVVGCDAAGNVDLEDLAAKIAAHAGALAAVMITYPSTHGVFEATIRAICDQVHAAGGQVYLDGANLNAQVGLARPGDYGADVCHLNLHKTFCIPHGGGGPGVGPIAVKSHLRAYLPGDPLLADSGAVSAARYGSASILPITYMYLRLMGAAGLRQASAMALLAANYVAHRLAPHFPVLYHNARGRVAHECIIDPRALADACGITVDDIAKRLIDYGFHAPTMSFPVAGTLMIEPTESESMGELDRFCEAMIAIRAEIADIEHGRWTAADSPLRHAPHTWRELTVEQWERAYPRALGAVSSARTDRYWPPVGRIDNVRGDRHLVCTCAPTDEYDERLGVRTNE